MTSLHRPASLSLLLLAALAAPAHAEDDFVVDGPSAVVAPDTMARGRFQVEAGFQSFRDNGGDQRATGTPVTLRYGLLDTLELRVAADGRQTTRDIKATPQREAGYGDAAFGLRWNLLAGGGIVPKAAVQVMATSDSGTGAFKGNGTRPALVLSQSWSLTEQLSLGMSESVEWNKTAAGERYQVSAFAILLSTAWNERFSTFVELAAPQIAKNRFGGTQSSFDLGASFRLDKNLQADVALYKGMNKHTPEIGLGLNVAARF